MRGGVVGLVLQCLGHFVEELFCTFEIVKQHMQEKDRLSVRCSDDAVLGNLLVILEGIDVDFSDGCIAFEAIVAVIYRDGGRVSYRLLEQPGAKDEAGS